MITLDSLISYARENDCSDIHFTPGLPIVFRQGGKLIWSNFKLDNVTMNEMIFALMNPQQKKQLDNMIDVDLCYQSPDGGRQRVNIYKERENVCCALRILSQTIPTLEQLHLPDVLKKMALLPRGLILVTGPTGSGKSTTLAAMVDYINRNRATHILTIEDPIEYQYDNDKAMIHQREVGEDVSSFSGALRAALREDPDVILVGEMRDYETISAAITAAETGHLVLSTLHTIGAANTIDRIIDVFPAQSQKQVRAQLSSVLEGIITQQLLVTNDGISRIAALEILVGTDAVRNLIRENKCHQIGSMMQVGSKDGMQAMNQHLASLVGSGKVSLDVAKAASSDLNELAEYL